MIIASFRTRAWRAIAAAALLSVLLVAVLYVGWRLADLSFAPFNVFDGITRLLPGSVLTFGIDHMVALIRALNLGATAGAAKAAEHALAVGAFLVLCTSLGVGIYAAVRLPRGIAYASGIAGGLVVGVAVSLIGASLGRANTQSVLSTLVAFAVWGAALTWSALRLRSPTLGRAEPEGRVERLDRRHFLIRLGSATVVITVAGAAVGRLSKRKRVPPGERWSKHNSLPNAGASVQPVPGTRPEFTPLEEHYRIDIDTMAPHLDEDSWRLAIGGLVDRPRTLSLERLRAYEPLHQFVTLSCISNPVGGDLIGTTRWTGVSLQRLLPDLGLLPRATHLKLIAADGFHEVVALDTIRADERVMLAYAWDGLPLTVEHGFPLRIYIPDHYGMKQPKWIVRIEALDHAEPGYWVQRGWDREARMKTTSVIDTIDVRGLKQDATGVVRVPIGGIAHAGARGISRVEVRVDAGPWQEAALRTPLSPTTWVVWRAELAVDRGHHVFTVRCYDATGKLQSDEISKPHPSGASGWNTRSRTV